MYILQMLTKRDRVKCNYTFFTYMIVHTPTLAKIMYVHTLVYVLKMRGLNSFISKEFLKKYAENVGAVWELPAK